jgi:hypothetical protein
MKEPLVPPQRSTSSSSPPPYTLSCPYGFIVKMEEEQEEEEEERHVRLEKRLVPNFDFDDNTLEDHVWFKDRWMVASLRDERLTTLCGLILG